MHILGKAHHKCLWLCSTWVTHPQVWETTGMCIYFGPCKFSDDDLIQYCGTDYHTVQITIVLYIRDHEGLGFSGQIYHPKTSLTIYIGECISNPKCLQSGQKHFQ